MRPFASIGVLKYDIDVGITVLVPSKSLAPVSPSNAHRCHGPGELAFPAQSVSQTMAFDVPSVVVTIGEPSVPFAAHQTTVGVGGLVAEIRTTMRLPPFPSGQPTPL